MSEPLRIAQVLNRMDSGGIEMVVLNYYDHIDHDIVQFDFLYNENSTLPKREDMIRLGARLYPVPDYWHVRAYNKALVQALRNGGYQIVHVHMSSMSVFALFAAWRARIPVRICHNHTTANLKEGTRALLKYLLRPLSKLFANEYFACSEHAGRWMYTSRFYDSGKVTIVPNAIDIANYAYDESARERLRGELSIANDAYVVGHVGRFAAQKNHAFLLDVFVRLCKRRPNARLLLVGEGALLEKAKQRAQKLGVDEKVIFTGARNDLNKLYSVMDVFCLPSLYEGFGMVTIEAQANGLTCVCSDAVPRETDITKRNHYLKAKRKQADVWVKTLLEAKRNEKRGTLPLEWDIDFQAERLTRLYTDMMHSE